VTTNTRNIVLTRPKSAFWGIFGPIVTLTFDFLTPKIEAFILAQSPLVAKVWSNCINKIRSTQGIVLTMFETHARTHGHTTTLET